MSSGLISSHFTRRIARAIACTPQDVVDQTLAAVSGDSLDILQQKNSELRATLQRLQWPRLLRFHSGGETHELPVRSQSEASLVSAAAEERLQYLAGFFDGDGCVHAQISGCALSVTQSFDQADILLYRATLGGSIVKLCDGRGLQRPSLRWTISGPAARRAAHLLAPYSITKHKQLLLATDWPDETSGRQACRVELSSLKRFDSAVARQCSLEYLTGFFRRGRIHTADCDGCCAAPNRPEIRDCVELLATDAGPQPRDAGQPVPLCFPICLMYPWHI